MRLFAKLGWWGAVAGAALITAAAAPPEQWLTYHLSAKGRGYRWLELTTNAPPNVGLPKLNAPPYFARWTTPLDPSGGRWICLDRTRRSGPYNRIFIDSNGNGRLDDKTPIDLPRLDDYSASFDGLRFVFKGEDGPITYHLALRFMKYDNGEVRLLASSACFYDGTVDLGGRKRRVTLLDGNVNGTFNDCAPDPADADRIVVEGDTAGERVLGRLLEVGDQLFRVEAARDGAFVKVQPAQDLTMGQVRVPESISELVAVGEVGHFIRKPAKGELTLPVGKYRVHAWSIERKDNKGAVWKLAGSGFSEFARFEVGASQPVTVEVGEPVMPALTATETKGSVAFGLRLRGRLGESVDLQQNDQRPRAPQLVLASAAGTFRATNTFEFG